MKKNRKLLVISGLVAVSVIVAGAFMLNQNPKGEDAPQYIDGIVKDVTPSGIEAPAVAETPIGTESITDTDNESLTGLEIPVIKPNEPTVLPIVDITPIERATPAPNQSTAVSVQSDNEIALTVITGKPEPPELPETAFVWEQDEEVTPEDVAAYEALDPALKNPDIRPDTTPAPVQSTPAPQATNSGTSQTTPNSGNADNNGLTYFPGFGWIKYEGGGTEVTQSQLDPNHTDFDKIIGY